MKTESTLCRVLKPVRIYGAGYKEGDELEIKNIHLNHYGRSIEAVKEKKEIKTKKEEIKNVN